MCQIFCDQDCTFHVCFAYFIEPKKIVAQITLSAKLRSANVVSGILLILQTRLAENDSNNIKYLHRWGYRPSTTHILTMKTGSIHNIFQVCQQSPLFFRFAFCLFLISCLKYTQRSTWPTERFIAMAIKPLTRYGLTNLKINVQLSTLIQISTQLNFMHFTLYMLDSLDASSLLSTSQLLCLCLCLRLLFLLLLRLILVSPFSAFVLSDAYVTAIECPSPCRSFSSRLSSSLSTSPLLGQVRNVEYRMWRCLRALLSAANNKLIHINWYCLCLLGAERS